MGNINWGRVIGCGLLTGFIVNVCEFIVNGFVLTKDWEAAMAALGRPSAMSVEALVAFNLWGFATGIGAMWLYAAIRPRFGPGPGTAMKAALAMWVFNYVLGSIGVIAMGLFPTRLMVIGLAVGIVEIIAGTLAGARFYTEAETTGLRTMAAGVR